MCGFLGCVSLRVPIKEKERNIMRRGAIGLAHRGPDGAGEWFDEHAFLAHRRLKIIDLSDQAAQPFVAADERYVMVFNGEIYNYLELRELLRKLGHQFRTASDTEVLMAAWRQWRNDAFHRLDGMFALAIYDRQSREVILARDPLGQKPLYWSWDGQSLCFGSELSIFLDSDGRQCKLDRPAFLRFLAHSYYGGDETPLHGVRKLWAGCLLTLRPDEAPQVERYWESLPGRPWQAWTLDAALERFDALFSDSCRISLRADVPQGVFLSGGIDSTLVTAVCAELDPEIRTYSVAMAERDYDERTKAALVVKHLGLRNHTVVEMNDDSIRWAAADFFAGLSEPHGDPGYINSLFLAHAVRKDITVAQAGDGADELFYGYAPFQGAAASRVLECLPGVAINWIKGAGCLLPRGSDGYLSLAFKVDAYLQGFPAPRATRAANWLSTLSPEGLAALCPWAPDTFLVADGRPESLFQPVAAMMQSMTGASVDQILAYYYQKFFLPEFVCLHTDRAAMRAGLEVRSPFLSVPLVEFANGLPDALKRNGSTLKRLLRESLRRRGFPSAIWRQRKQGFTLPLARYLKSALRPQLLALLDDGVGVGGLVECSELERLISDHLNGKANNYRILFNLLAFQSWFKRYPHVQC